MWLRLQYLLKYWGNDHLSPIDCLATKELIVKIEMVVINQWLWSLKQNKQVNTNKLTIYLTLQGRRSKTCTHQDIALKKDARTGWLAITTNKQLNDAPH